MTAVRASPGGPLEGLNVAFGRSVSRDGGVRRQNCVRPAHGKPTSGFFGGFRIAPITGEIRMLGVAEPRRIAQVLGFAMNVPDASAPHGQHHRQTWDIGLDVSHRHR